MNGASTLRQLRDFRINKQSDFLSRAFINKHLHLMSVSSSRDEKWKKLRENQIKMSHKSSRCAIFHEFVTEVTPNHVYLKLSIVNKQVLPSNDHFKLKPCDTGDEEKLNATIFLVESLCKNNNKLFFFPPHKSQCVLARQNSQRNKHRKKKSLRMTNKYISVLYFSQ